MRSNLERILGIIPPRLRGDARATFLHKLLVRALIMIGRLENPALTAFVLRFGIQRTAIAGRSGRKPRHHLLILSKAMFNEDMEASFGGQEEFVVYRMHRRLIKAVSHRFIPRHVDDNNYANLSREDEARKRRYRDYWEAVWRRLSRRIRIDAVLTGNFAYYAERELGGALERIGTPFIAVHKECVRSPGYAEFFRRIYRERRGPFTGRRILCYDEAERRLEIEAGIAPPERIRVTGMPRLDFVHRRRRVSPAEQAPRRPRVLFFSFGPKTTLPVMVRKMSRPPYKRYTEPLESTFEHLHWTTLHRQVHAAMLQLALQAPDIDVVIKTKGVLGEREEAMIKRVMNVARLPENLEVVLGGNPHTLLVDCDVVCGFNSTALLEAIAADRPVVVPRFAEAAHETMRSYLIDYEDAAEYAISPDTLVEQLLRHARERRLPRAELPDNARRVLRRWLHNDDGRAGERVRLAVLQELGPRA